MHDRRIHSLFMRPSLNFQFAQATVLAHMTISFDATNRTLTNSRKQAHPDVLCSCGARSRATTPSLIISTGALAAAVRMLA
jgi:hypothetical protein